MCISTKTVLKTIWTENLKAPGMFWIQKSYNWMKINSVKYPVWLKVLSKPAILKYHRSQASLKPQGIKDCLFVIMHETNWGKTQLEVETITGDMAPQQAGCPLVDDTATRLLAPDALPCQVAPVQSSSLGLINTEIFFFKPKQPKKVLSFFLILSKKKHVLWIKIAQAKIVRSVVRTLGFSSGSVF